MNDRIHNFTNFHILSNYSNLKSILRLSDIIYLNNIQKLNFISLTAERNLSLYFDSLELIKNSNLKPVFGCIVHIKGIHRKKSYPIILIAKSEKGLENIFKINTFLVNIDIINKSYLTIDELIKYKEGLACIIEEEILDNLNEKIETIINKYKEIFEDDLYIELNHTGKDKLKILYTLDSIINKYNLKGIASCTELYLYKDKEIFNNFFELLIHLHKEKTENYKNILKYDFSYKTNDVIIKLFKNHQIYIDNNINLIKSIKNIDITPDYFQKKAYRNIKKLILKKLNKIKFGNKNYYKIILKELKYLKETNLSIILYISYKIKNFYKKKQTELSYHNNLFINSLCAYILGMSEINPVDNDIYNNDILLFEKNNKTIFVDIFEKMKIKDLCYFSDKDYKFLYGCNYQYFSLKYLLHYFGKKYKLEKKILSLLLKNIRDRNSLKCSSLEFEDSIIGDIYRKNPLVKKILKSIELILYQILDIIPDQHTYICLPKNYNYYTPIYNKERNLFFCNIKSNNSLFNSIKFHSSYYILSLKKLIKREKINKDLLEKELPYILYNNYTYNINFFNNKNIRNIIKNNRDKILKLSDLISNYHNRIPIDNYFLNNKDNPLVLIYKKYTENTEYSIIFKDQIYNILNAVFNYNKNIIYHIFCDLENKNFLAIKDILIKVFNKISLNEKLSYELYNYLIRIYPELTFKYNLFYRAYYSTLELYIKLKYSSKYFCNILNYNINNKYSLNKILFDIYINFTNIFIKKPDINESFYFYKERNNEIISGFGIIKNINKVFIKNIINERNNNGRFLSFYDFLKRMSKYKLSINTIKILIKTSCFDKLESDQNLMLDLLKKFSLENLDKDERSLFNLNELIETNTHNSPYNKNDEDKLLQYLKYTNTYYRFSDFFNKYKDYINNIDKNYLKDIKYLKEGSFSGYIYNLKKSKQNTLKGFLADDTALVEIIINENTYKTYRNLLKNYKLLIITGKIENQKINCEVIYDFEEYIKK